MRKIVVAEFVSLDGVIQAPGGADEDREGGFVHGGWTHPYWHDDIGAHFFQALRHLLAWLLSLEITQVAMESTGEFWKPVFNLLEGQLIILVVNAAHVKYVPGRKSDVKDAEWIAELLAHGLLRPSFVPPAPSVPCAT